MLKDRVRLLKASDRALVADGALGFLIGAAEEQVSASVCRSKCVPSDDSPAWPPSPPLLIRPVGPSSQAPGHYLHGHSRLAWAMSLWPLCYEPLLHPGGNRRSIRRSRTARLTEKPFRVLLPGAASHKGAAIHITPQQVCLCAPLRKREGAGATGQVALCNSPTAQMHWA